MEHCPPPLAGQNSVFFDFFERKYIVCFCPAPWKILPSNGIKCADAHDTIIFFILPRRLFFPVLLSKEIF